MRFHRLAETVPTSRKPEPRAKKQAHSGSFLAQYVGIGSQHWVLTPKLSWILLIMFPTYLILCILFDAGTINLYGGICTVSHAPHPQPGARRVLSPPTLGMPRRTSAVTRWLAATSTRWFLCEPTSLARRNGEPWQLNFQPLAPPRLGGRARLLPDGHANQAQLLAAPCPVSARRLQLTSVSDVGYCAARPAAPPGVLLQPGLYPN